MYHQDEWEGGYQIGRPRGDENFRSQCEVGHQWESGSRERPGWHVLVRIAFVVST